MKVDMKTTRIKGDRCPACGEAIGASTSFVGGKPKPGDVSVCMCCGWILIYNADLTSRIPNAGEMVELMRSSCWPDLERMQKAVRRMKELISTR